MKRKVDWKNTNAFGGVVLELTTEERESLNCRIAAMNQGDCPVMATLVNNGHIYLSTIHGEYCYTIDTLNGILFLNSLFDFGVSE